MFCHELIWRYAVLSLNEVMDPPVTAQPAELWFPVCESFCSQKKISKIMFFVATRGQLEAIILSELT